MFAKAKAEAFGLREIQALGAKHGLLPVFGAPACESFFSSAAAGFPNFGQKTPRKMIA